MAFGQIQVLYRPPDKPLEPQGFGGFLYATSTHPSTHSAMENVYFASISQYEEQAAGLKCKYFVY